MALFDFRCENGHSFDAFQKGPDAGKVATCPECGLPAPRIWVTPPGFKISFRDGYDECTGCYHPNQKHYNNWIREHGAVKV